MTLTHLLTTHLSEGLNSIYRTHADQSVSASAHKSGVGLFFFEEDFGGGISAIRILTSLISFLNALPPFSMEKVKHMNQLSGHEIWTSTGHLPLSYRKSIHPSLPSYSGLLMFSPLLSSTAYFIYLFLTSTLLPPPTSACFQDSISGAKIF